MFDIMFLSYDEPNADKNFRALRARFPHARRVHGVKGIANAHFFAARLANTSCFYVVDADAEVLDSFKFDYKPPEWDRQYVHVWAARNPIGTTYGYGGVKLFSKHLFTELKTQLDFTTTLATGIKLMGEVSCVTRFNSDPYRAFRGAFREGAKLQSTIRSNKPEAERAEAAIRLAKWLDPRDDCDYRDYVSAGALAGVQEANASPDDLLFINDHDLTVARLTALYPNAIQPTDPTPREDHPMKCEFFFTTRIASALYDPNVLRTLPVTELRDALSDGQLLSKNWVIDELEKLISARSLANGRDAKVVILGGWIGTLALLAFARGLPVDVTSVDLDGRANAIASTLNWDQKFKAVKADMYDVDYSEYDVIINTSSEHIPDIPAWRSKLPPNKLVIVQNNDYAAGAGHVSTVDNSDQLRRALNLQEVVYEGTRQFSAYSRFMLIGVT